MEKILGKYNEALVYASVIEEKAAEQIRSLCDLEIYKDSKIRIMPDVHINLDTHSVQKPCIVISSVLSRIAYRSNQAEII